MIMEHGRGLHTLDEHHSHLLADSFGGSIGGSALGGAGPSSSQFDNGFGLGFDDNVFALPEGAGDADIGDELARELGEGWGGSALLGFVFPRQSLVDHCLTAFPAAPKNQTPLTSLRTKTPLVWAEMRAKTLGLTHRTRGCTLRTVPPRPASMTGV